MLVCMFLIVGQNGRADPEKVDIQTHLDPGSVLATLRSTSAKTAVKTEANAAGVTTEAP